MRDKLRAVKNIYFRYASSEQVIRKQFKKRLNREPVLDNPILFTDKLQWLKLNWYDPVATKMADKYAVREVVTGMIGEQYLNELYAVYNDITEFNIDDLPKSFVLKGTHGSGYNMICKNKNKVNWIKQKKEMKSWFNDNYYWNKREWVYKDIPPRIICERILSDEELNKNGLVDFKFYCFNGIPHYCQVIQGRGGHETIDFYDMEWNHMSFNGMRSLPRSKVPMKKPIHFNEMIELSQRLSKQFPFVRVDWYYVNNKIYFGELTFFPTSGMGQFNPPEWDKKMGDLLELPSQ